VAASGTVPAGSALAGLRVLDLGTFIAAPFAAGLLAELGAAVIKVEQPGPGDPIRDLGDKVQGRTLFWALEGRGRRSVTCNLRHPHGQEIVLQLARRSDLVIENFRPARWSAGTWATTACARRTPASSCCASPPTVRPAPSPPAPDSGAWPRRSGA
jgi:crotonobetainyl-CoA:carnitine CoA-transferase CaiB-like acyl-CoA transferase